MANDLISEQPSRLFYFIARAASAWSEWANEHGVAVVESFVNQCAGQAQDR
jgi:hypothetical protein